jgi:hypothetical protein
MPEGEGDGFRPDARWCECFRGGCGGRGSAEGSRRAGLHWVYRTKTDFPNAQSGKPSRLLIEAEDLPGNVVTHTVDGEL